MKAAKPPALEKARDDLLDVHALGVVSGVDEHLSLWAQLETHCIRRSPVRQVGAVEPGLEKLVLDQQTDSRGQCGVDLLQAFTKAHGARTQVVLARIVGAVRKPQADDRRPRLVGDLDAFEDVIYRPAPHRGRRIGQAAEHVVVVLKQVRIDRPDLYPMVLGNLVERIPIIHAVPRDVYCDRRTNPRQAVHHPRVRELLLDGAGGARLSENLEPRPRVAIAPRGGFDPKPVDALDHARISQGERPPAAPRGSRCPAGSPAP